MNEPRHGISRRALGVAAVRRSCLLMLVFVGLGLAPSAQAAVCVVTTTVDSVTGGSLRACIIWANGNAGPDTLTVPAGTYTLTIAGTGEDAAATGALTSTAAGGKPHASPPATRRVAGTVLMTKRHRR